MLTIWHGQAIIVLYKIIIRRDFMDITAIYKIGYGLYVLTARDGDKTNGCIVNTFMQITSGDKIICALSVNKSNYTHDMIVKTREFNVSCLTSDTPFEMIERFGFRSGRDTDKLSGFNPIAFSKNNLPYLTENANAYISLKVKETVDCGTHTIFLAEVTDAENLSDGESLTYAYYHRNIKPKPEKTAKTTGWRCKICGYIYEGDDLPADFVCPICKHGAADFEQI